jgi:ferrous iron transport protein B
VAEATEDLPRHLPKHLTYGEDIESAAKTIENRIKHIDTSLVEKYPLRWLTFKFMEGDSHVHKEIVTDNDALYVNDAISHLINAHGPDIEATMADARYAQAAGLAREVLKKPEFKEIELTEKIDKIVLNRFMGIPVFLAAMWLVFKLTVDLSKPFADWMNIMTSGPFRRWAEVTLNFLKAPDWTVSLVTDGIVAGVGSVLVFVPVIFAMMFFITFLEGSGYMARAAFVMDRVMHTIGLHGKSFIPMLLGFGCNVPAVYATRTRL